MPGFIIHLAEATMIIDYMKKKPDTKWCYEFLMGSLLPDTRLGDEKKFSHFFHGFRHIEHTSPLIPPIRS